jgi:hypothetical protein
MMAALYIALGLLVAAAVGMQVWMLRSAAATVPQARLPLVRLLRGLNIALLLVAAGLVAYALTAR